MGWPKGRSQSAEHRAKIGQANTGHSAESIERRISKIRGVPKKIIVEYGGIHRRASLVLPRACAEADETCRGRLEVAFRHDTPVEFVRRDLSSGGKPYSVRVEDYRRLCRSHHVRYDAD